MKTFAEATTGKTIRKVDYWGHGFVLFFTDGTAMRVGATWDCSGLDTKADLRWDEVCSTCGKLENSVCSNAWHLTKYPCPWCGSQLRFLKRFLKPGEPAQPGDTSVPILSDCCGKPLSITLSGGVKIERNLETVSTEPICAVCSRPLVPGEILVIPPVESFNKPEPRQVCSPECAFRLGEREMGEYQAAQGKVEG